VPVIESGPRHETAIRRHVPGSDGIRRLRVLLKYAGRYLGLRAIDAREQAPTQTHELRHDVAKAPRRASPHPDERGHHYERSSHGTSTTAARRIDDILKRRWMG
jgi:hypothetical protein